MGKWSCGCPDGVVNGIHAAVFDCPLTLFSIYNSVYLYIVGGCCPLFVPSCLYFPLFLPFSLSVLLSFCLSYSSIGLSLPNLPWFGTFFLLLFLSFSFSSSSLFLRCSLFPLWTLFSGRVSIICCCSLRPRNLYLSGRKHRYGIWLYWMAIREEKSI